MGKMQILSVHASADTADHGKKMARKEFGQCDSDDLEEVPEPADRIGNASFRGGSGFEECSADRQCASSKKSYQESADVSRGHSNEFNRHAVLSAHRPGERSMVTVEFPRTDVLSAAGAARLLSAPVGSVPAGTGTADTDTDTHADTDTDADTGSKRSGAGSAAVSAKPAPANTGFSNTVNRRSATTNSAAAARPATA